MQTNPSLIGVQQTPIVSIAQSQEPGELLSAETRPFSGQRNVDLLALLQSLSTTSFVLGPAAAQVVPRLLEPFMTGSELNQTDQSRSNSTVDAMTQLFQSLTQSYASSISANALGTFEFNHHMGERQNPTGCFLGPSYNTPTLTTAEQTVISPKSEPHVVRTSPTSFSETQLQTHTSPSESNSTKHVPTMESGQCEKQINQSGGTSEQVNGTHVGVTNSRFSGSKQIGNKLVGNWLKMGVPQPATPTRFTAPVHVDVGGTLYTSSLETLTKYPNSRLGQMFNGTIPIVLDTMKQHYFIDRDGALFRFVLNFLRTGKVNVHANFEELDQLIQESTFYELDEMSSVLRELQSRRANCNALRKQFSKRTNVVHSNEHKIEGEPVSKRSVADTNRVNDFVLPQKIDRTELTPESLSNEFCSCVWLELDNRYPYTGFIRVTRPVNRSTQSFLQSVLEYVDFHCKCKDHSTHPYSSNEEFGCQWHELTRCDVLYLWQLILQHQYRLCTTIHSSHTSTDIRDVHLLYRMHT